MEFKEVIIYTDGACSGNPGPGGYAGILIYDQKTVIEIGDGELATTNNRMEMMAVEKSLLAALKSGVSQITVYTDSVYVIRGITQWIWGWKKRGWKNTEGEAVSNQDLWERLDRVVSALSEKKISISWKYVRGHKGIPGNERCDEIAVAFSKSQWIDLYQGAASGYLFDVSQLPTDEPLPEMKNNYSKDASAKKESWYISLINGVVTKYKTWSECEAAVKGRPGVKFKKVTSAEEEITTLKGWGV